MVSLFNWLRRRECVSVSETGLVRSENQDAFFVDANRRLFCVADGLGGGAAGGTASRILCEELSHCKTDAPTLARAAGEVDEAVRRAHARIRQIVRTKGYETMGSTLAVLLFCPSEPDLVAIGHVGDSRVYRRRGATLKQMTRDHRKSAFSHILTRAVGVAETVEMEWLQASTWTNDLWLVCTDGVHDMLPDATINGILSGVRRTSAQAARLAAAVKRAGARDNFTFCLVRQ